MYRSIFSQRWLKYICQPKKYLVSLEVKVGHKFTFTEIEVEAKTKYEARHKAKEHVKRDIKINYKGLRSLGRIKRFEEF